MSPNSSPKLVLRLLTIGVLATVLTVCAQLASSQLPAQLKKETTETKPDVYYPGTEELAADEMRVVACGTGGETGSSVLYSPHD